MSTFGVIKVEEESESFLLTPENSVSDIATKEEEDLYERTQNVEKDFKAEDKEDIFDVAADSTQNGYDLSPKQEEEDIFGAATRRGGQIDSISSKAKDTRALKFKDDFTYRFSFEPSFVGPDNSKIRFVVVYTCALSSLRSYLDELPEQAVLGFGTRRDGHLIQLCCLETRTILVFCMPVSAIQEYIEACSAAISIALGSDRYLKVAMLAIDQAITLSRFYKVINVFDLYLLAEDLEISVCGDIAKSLSDDKHRGIAIKDTRKCKRSSHGLAKLRKKFIGYSFDCLQCLGSKPYPGDRKAGKSLIDSKYSHLLSQFVLFDAAKEALFAVLAYDAMITKFSKIEIAAYRSTACDQLNNRLSKLLPSQANNARAERERKPDSSAHKRSQLYPEPLQHSTRADIPPKTGSKQKYQQKRKHENDVKHLISNDCDVKPHESKETKFQKI